MAQGDLILTDPKALRSLAHPVLLAILERLQNDGPATATGCGGAVGISASAASYHLRSLARWGLVVEAAGGKGRERPWQAAAAGFSFESHTAETPAERAAASALGGTLIASGERWTAEFARHEHDYPAPWRRASHLANKTLRVTPAEAETIVAEIEKVLEPYLRSSRTDAPEDAIVARLLLRLFPRDVPA